MDTTLLWLQLAAAAAIILGASWFLAKSADVIAFKTGLGRSFVGVVLLATATSLPELGTGVSAIALLDEPDLALGDAFGSNLFNLLIIGLLDLYWRDGPVLTKVGPTAAIVGALGIAVIGIAALALLVHGATTAMSGWHIGRSKRGPVGDVPDGYAAHLPLRPGRGAGRGGEEYESGSLAGAFLRYLVSAALVVGAAVWLANSGDHIAEAMGWEASFVGTQFLAFSTSLPELAASFAAVRLGAPELAIGNILGSNVFNMGFVLFLDDVAFADGAIWTVASDVHVLTAVFAMFMTALVIVAITMRPRGRPVRFITYEGAATHRAVRGGQRGGVLAGLTRSRKRRGATPPRRSPALPHAAACRSGPSRRPPRLSATDGVPTPARPETRERTSPSGPACAG